MMIVMNDSLYLVWAMFIIHHGIKCVDKVDYVEIYWVKWMHLFLFLGSGHIDLSG